MKKKLYSKVIIFIIYHKLQFNYQFLMSAEVPQKVFRFKCGYSFCLGIRNDKKLKMIKFNKNHII